MKKLLILIPIVVLTLALAGCIPGLTPAPEPEESVMEAVALAELNVSGNILWSIINTGDVFIREYTLTFEVEYPTLTKDFVVVTYDGEYLEVGDMHTGKIKLGIIYDTPESVSVTWELFE